MGLLSLIFWQNILQWLVFIMRHCRHILLDGPAQCAHAVCVRVLDVGTRFQQLFHHPAALMEGRDDQARVATLVHRTASVGVSPRAQQLLDCLQLTVVRLQLSAVAGRI